ncbi:beta-galactoside alpha-2,6-sialyltransferase 1-like [Glandiceps talaboti]
MGFRYRRRDESPPTVNLHMRFLCVVLVMFTLLPLYVILLSRDDSAVQCKKLSEQKRILMLHVKDILERYHSEEWVDDIQAGEVDLGDPEIQEAIENLVYAFRNYTTRTRENATLLENPNSESNQEDDLKGFIKRYDSKYNNYFLMTLGNPYGVNFTGQIRNRNGREILCDLKKRAPYDVLKQSTSPFKEMGVSHNFPDPSIFDLYGTKLKRCAVVASAAFLNGSKLGKEIDSHDAVLRFNDAPTQGFEEDVGTKTTVRLINTKVFSDERFGFKKLDIFRNVTLAIWKSGPYNGNLYRFYTLYKDCKEFFENYFTWRQTNPWELLYIIDPNGIWRTWDIIQENTLNVTLRKTMPSSGIIGISLMQSLCDTVDVYGYIIPSKSQLLCRYYDTGNTNVCSRGTWHPVEYEKEVIRRANIGHEEDIDKRGRITLPGYRTLVCD